MAEGTSGAHVVLPDHGDTHDLLVVDHGRITRPFKHGYLAASEPVLSAANVRDLGIAARDERRCCAELPELILITPKGYKAELWEGDPFEPDQIAVEISQNTVAAIVGPRLVDSRREKGDMLELLNAVASRRRCTAALEISDEYGNDIDTFAAQISDWPESPPEDERSRLLNSWLDAPGYLTVRVTSLDPDSAIVASLIASARDAAAALDAIDSRSPRDPRTVAALLRAGLDDALPGLVESSWLEAKAEPYPFDADKFTSRRAKHRLACDVAAFANGSVPALLVVGVETENRSGRDYVVRVHPLPADRLNPGQYVDVLNDRIFPAVQALNVEAVDRPQGRLLLIEIPVQPDELQPFLVHGGFDGDKISGTQITVVQRQSDRNVMATPGQIHASMAAGRALLRGRRCPPRWEWVARLLAKPGRSMGSSSRMQGYRDEPLGRRIFTVGKQRSPDSGVSHLRWHHRSGSRPSCFTSRSEAPLRGERHGRTPGSL